MNERSLRAHARAYLPFAWSSVTVFLHTSRAVDIMLSGERIVLDGIGVIAAAQSGDEIFILAAICRLVFEAAALTHSIWSLVKDHHEWWAERLQHPPDK